jgi:hypothetical protein
LPSLALVCALLVAALAGLTTGGVAQAHEIRPALLQITETTPGRYDVLWKQPVVGDMAIHLVPHLSGKSIDRKPDSETFAPGYLMRGWRVVGGAPLDGQTIEIEGLAQSVTDTLVRVTGSDGRAVNEVIHPAAPSLVLQMSGPKGVAVPAYLTLGVEHILTGLDHLAFVLGLLLLIGPSWRIVKAVSAFTVAHSITLALAALGVVHFPPALIEALVALSIVFVASELLPRPGQPPTLTRRHPWLIAFIFGLLHGLAFASSLAQIGLPAKAAPLALLLFNVGVEIGQLMFIAAALAVIVGLRFVRSRLRFDTTVLARVGPAYAIGGFAAFWFIERLVTVFA